MTHLILLPLLASLLPGPTIDAQTPSSPTTPRRGDAAIAGRVLDEAGAPLHDANRIAQGTTIDLDAAGSANEIDLVLGASGASNLPKESGRFDLGGLGPGQVSLYASGEIDGVPVAASERVEIAGVSLTEGRRIHRRYRGRDRAALTSRTITCVLQGV